MNDAAATPPADAALARLDLVRSELNAWLFAAALPTWWSMGADLVRGGFRDALDAQGRPARERSRLRVQARQVYVYATAARLGWDGSCRQAVQHGLDWILNRHRREDGLYRTLVSIDGDPLDETATLYDQAFVLLALASAADFLPARKADLEEEALRLARNIHREFRHPVEGFVENESGREFQANAQMHLFEAALTWSRVGADPSWRSLADELGHLCCRRFIDPKTGALREFFDDQWRPAPGELGKRIEPGHQFEWAWLLVQWSWLDGGEQAVRTAERLFEVGELGVDHGRMVAQNEMSDSLEVQDASARLWPQTERVKAAHLLAEIAPTEELRQAHIEAVNEAARGLQQYLTAAVPGLWWDVLRADGAFVEEPAPASSFYHLIGAVAELNGLRIVDRHHTAAGKGS